MTLATSMLYPSNFLQNTYLQLVEYEKGSKIGSPLPGEICFYDDQESEQTSSYQLAVRMTSAVHAALQFVCAAIETLPLLAVTTITVLYHATGAGFVTENGGRLERIRLAAATALASLWAPVGSSLYAVYKPSDLSSENPFVLASSIEAQSRLLAYTVPSLPKLAEIADHSARSILEQGLGLRKKGLCLRKQQGIDPLEALDIKAFKWRSQLATNLANSFKERLEIPTFDLPTYKFSETLTASVFEHATREDSDASEDDEAPTHNNPPSHRSSSSSSVESDQEGVDSESSSSEEDG